MRKFRWSQVYPKSWQIQFGDEFDAMLELRPARTHDVVDILFNAGEAHLKELLRFAPFVLAWAAIGFVNVIATEVQWPAGMLLLSCAVATLRRPRAWLKYALLFALVIPISSIYFYQIPGIHHEPLYKTAVALIPALAGSLIGAAIRFFVMPSSQVEEA